MDQSFLLLLSSIYYCGTYAEVPFYVTEQEKAAQGGRGRIREVLELVVEGIPSVTLPGSLVSPLLCLSHHHLLDSLLY